MSFSTQSAKWRDGVNSPVTVEYRSSARICRESTCEEGNRAYTPPSKKDNEVARTQEPSAHQLLVINERRQTFLCLILGSGRW